MTISTTSPNLLADPPIPVRVKLAAAWASFLFLYVYVDIIALYKPGVVDDILVGVVWEFGISVTWAIIALSLLAMPILMIVLSVMLPARASRITNLVVAAIQIPFAGFNAVGELGEPWLPFYVLGVALELAVLAVIVRSAWTWPRASAIPAGHATTDLRQDLRQ